MSDLDPSHSHMHLLDGREFVTHGRKLSPSAFLALSPRLLAPAISTDHHAAEAPAILPKERSQLVCSQRLLAWREKERLQGLGCRVKRRRKSALAQLPPTTYTLLPAPYTLHKSAPAQLPLLPPASQPARASLP
jgi:hypothetical protein